MIADYTHVRYRWKASAAFAFNPNTATYEYPMPVSMDFNYPAPASDGPADPLGDVSAGTMTSRLSLSASQRRLRSLFLELVTGYSGLVHVLMMECRSM